MNLSSILRSISRHLTSFKESSAEVKDQLLLATPLALPVDSVVKLTLKRCSYYLNKRFEFGLSTAPYACYKLSQALDEHGYECTIVHGTFEEQDHYWVQCNNRIYDLGNSLMYYSCVQSIATSSDDARYSAITEHSVLEFEKLFNRYLKAF